MSRATKTPDTAAPAGAARLLGIALCAALGLQGGGCRELAGYSAAARPDLVGSADGAHRRDGATIDGPRDGDSPRDGGTPRDSGGPRDGTGTRDGTACAEHSVSLGTADDDGELWASDFRPQGETPGAPYPDGLYTGNWFYGPTWAFFRFLVPATLPRVDHVYLDLWGLGTTKNWDPTKHALLVRLELSVDPPAVTGINDDPGKSAGRPLTGARVRWPATGGLVWQTAYNRSPELAPLFTELAEASGQGGWNAGMAVQLWLRGDFPAGATDEAEVITPYFGQSSYGAQPAKLTFVVCGSP